MVPVPPTGQLLALQVLSVLVLELLCKCGETLFGDSLELSSGAVHGALVSSAGKNRSIVSFLSDVIISGSLARLEEITCDVLYNIISITYWSWFKPNCCALLFIVPLSTSNESKLDDIIRILLASLNLLNVAQGNGDTAKAGELTSELLLPFTIGAAAVDDGSSIVPSKTVVVPSVL